MYKTFCLTLLLAASVSFAQAQATLPQLWVDNNEATDGISYTPPAYELSLPNTWVTGPPGGCTFHLPYWSGSATLTGLQLAVNDIEACRTGTNVGIILDIPPAVYTGAAGLAIPQTSSTLATTFLILRSTQDTFLPNGTTVCSHGIQDNLATSTDIGLNNPDCAGDAMYYVLGTTSTSVSTGIITLANGTVTNTSNYNDVQYMWTAEGSGTTPTALRFCSPTSTGGSGSAPPPCTSTTLAPDHWLIEDMEARIQAGDTNDQDIISMLGAGNETSITEYPTHIHFRKDWAHGDWSTIAAGFNSVSSAFDLICQYCSIVDSQSSQNLRPATEGHSVTMQGPGPAKFNHNWFEGQSIGMLSGGYCSLPSIANYVPFQDIEVRRNRFTFPYAWLGLGTITGNSHWNGSSLVRKNAIEIKEGERILRTGNILENVDNSGGQGGPLGDVKTDNNSCSPSLGTNYFSTTNDISDISNLWRNSIEGIQSVRSSAYNANGVTLGIKRWTENNSLFYNTSETNYGGSETIGIQLAAAGWDWQGTAVENSAGTQLTFTATCSVDQGLCPGQIASLAVATAGTGCVAGSLTFSNPDIVGGRRPKGTYTCSSGSLNAVTLTNTGAGYLSPPTATLATGTGTVTVTLVASPTAPGTGYGVFDISAGDPVGITQCNVQTSFNQPTTFNSSQGAYRPSAIGPLAISGTNPNSLVVTIPWVATPNATDTGGYCKLTNIQGYPQTMQFTHNTVISNSSLLLTWSNGINNNVSDGPNFQINSLFQNDIMIGAGGIDNSPLGEGNATIDFDFDATSLTLDHTVWPGRNATLYTALGNNPSYPVASPTIYLGTTPSTSYCTGASPTSACVGFIGAMSAGSMPLSLSDYHNFELISGSSFKSGGAYQASDGSDNGVNISALDAAQILDLYSCPTSCGSGPYADVPMPAPSTGGSTTFSSGNTLSAGYSISASTISPTPCFAYSPDPVAFGSVSVGQFTSLTVTITNGCGAALTINAVTVVPSTYSSYYSINADNCSFQVVLPAGGTCTMIVTFSPAAAVSTTASISVPDNTPETPDSIALNGTGSPISPTVNNPSCGTPPCPISPAFSGVPYLFTFGATGGTPPYTNWTFTSGTLPTGLSLNSSTGVISGTTSVSGTTDLTVQVTDSAAQTGTLAISLNVSAAPVANFYVAPNGNDTWSGTLPAPNIFNTDGPFLTLNKARQAVWTLSCGSGPPIVMVRQGSYYNTNVTFASNDGPGHSAPTSGCPVTYEEYPSDTQPAVLSGGVQLSGWTTSTAGGCANATATCYQTNISNTSPDFIRLWVNGVPRLRPRMGVSAYSITSVNSGSGGQTVYNGSFSGCGSNACLGLSFIISGFTAHTVNDGLFVVSASTTSQLTVNVGTGVAETHAAFAYNTVGTWGHSTGSLSGTTNCGSSTISNCGFTYTTSDPVPTSCTTDCLIWAVDKWAVFIMRWQSITAGSHSIFTTCNSASNCPGGGGPGPPYQNNYRYIIEGSESQMKYPGQWYLDKTPSGHWTVSYIPISNENMSTATVVIGSNAQTLIINGTQNTTFDGLTFQQDNWTPPSTGYLSTQLEPNLQTQMVVCNGCGPGVFFSGNTFQQTTTSGLSVLGSATGVTLESNVFLDNGAFGWQIGYSPESTSPNTASDSQVPHSITVTGNWSEGSGRIFPATDAWMIGLANNVTQSYNDYGFTYHAGGEVCKPGFPGPNECAAKSPSTGHGTFNIAISHDDCHNVAQGVSSDLGCVYVMTQYSNSGAGSATGNSIYYSRFHDVNSSAVAGDTTDPDGHCLYFDGFTGGWDVEYDLAYRCTGMLVNMNFGPTNSGQPNKFKNNIFLNAANYPSGGSNACIRAQNGCNNSAAWIASGQPTGNNCGGSGQPACLKGCNTACSVQAYTYTSNICGQDLSSLTRVNQQCGPTNNNTAPDWMDHVSNIYTFPNSTPIFTAYGGANPSFATWKSSLTEDTAGTITTTPKFTAPQICTGPYPLNTVPQTGCDNFGFTPSAGPGFGFNATPFNSPTYGPIQRLTLPVVADTFPVAVLPPSAFCATNCADQ